MGSCARLVTVENGNWGATSLSAIGAVLESTTSVLCNAFGRTPDAPVRVSPWERGPQVDWDRRPYRIRMSARDTYWCQYAYQFAHELCHILVNFDRLRHHRHKWFEESICELASLFALHRLSREFQHSPPVEVLGAQRFAPHFATYADEVAHSAHPVSRADLPAWISKNIRHLEERGTDRDLNRVVAIALLDDFLTDTSLWRDCGFLNLWNATADHTFPDHIDSWIDFLRSGGFVPRTPRLVRTLLLGTAKEDESLSAVKEGKA